MGFEIYGWPDPDILSIVLGGAFWNHANYENPTMIEALAAARYIMDPAERTAAYADIQQQLLDQDFTHMAAGAAVYLYFRQSQRPGLHGARIAILGVKRCRQRLRLIR